MNMSTQHEQIVSYCRNGRWITNLDAMQIGIGRLASRISELSRDPHYKVIRETRKVIKANGTTAHVTAYMVTEVA